MMISIALAYPDQPSANDMLSYRRFFTAWSEVLPCPRCARNFQEHMRRVPIDDYLVSRGWLFRWLELQYAMTAAETGQAPLAFRDMVRKYLRL